jgi:signal peptidase I
VSAHRVPRRHTSWRAVASALVLLAVAGLAVFSLYWFATGGRWLVVQTPSMGRSAPVGTLLWVEPAHDLHVGDVVSFRPPGSASTYTHRIHAIAADGAISTKGDGNPAADPWLLHRSDVTGVVAMRWWAVGWLIKAAPLLVLGGALLAVLVRRFTAIHWQVPAATLGIATLTTLSIWIYRPLVRAELVVFGHLGADQHAARATYVSTGLLPVRLTAAGSPPLVLNDGEFGSVVTRSVDAHGRFRADVAPHITWWMWVLLMTVCFLPALWSAIVGLAPARAVLRGKMAT